MAAVAEARAWKVGEQATQIGAPVGAPSGAMAVVAWQRWNRG